MDDKQFDPNLRVDKNLTYALRLPYEEASDLSGDLAIVQELTECILYVTQNQADKGGIEFANDNGDKYRYAEYYKACRTAMYLADYAANFLDDMLKNVAVSWNK